MNCFLVLLLFTLDHMFEVPCSLSIYIATRIIEQLHVQIFMQHLQHHNMLIKEYVHVYTHSLSIEMIYCIFTKIVTMDFKQRSYF